MAAECEGCGRTLEAEWVACPHCGRPASGRAGTEKLVRLVTKVGVDLLDVGLLQAEANAEEQGDRARAAQIALVRNLAKDIAPKIEDVVITYVYQRRVLESAPPPRKALAPHTAKAT
jgi:hypothetical protein